MNSFDDLVNPLRTYVITNNADVTIAILAALMLVLLLSLFGFLTRRKLKALVIELERKVAAMETAEGLRIGRDITQRRS